MSFGKTLLASILGTIIAGILMWFLFFMFIGILIVSSGSDTRIEPNSVLKLDLRGELVDKGNGYGSEFEGDFGFFENFNQAGVYEIINAIRHAKADKNIKGIYINPGIVQAGWSSLSAIREALFDFKTSGKFIYAYAELYSEKSYYLATAADQVFIFHSGFLEFNGLSSNPMYYKGMFDKLGIEPRVFRVGKFKSAVEPYMNDKMSDEARRQASELQKDVWGKFAEHIAAARKLTPEEIDSIAENGVLLNGKKAEAFKLVDGMKFEDEVRKMMEEKTGVKKSSELKMVSLKKYLQGHSTPPIGKNTKSKGKIAIIFAQGQIYDGKQSRENIGSETLSKLLRDAREDTSIKAVVLRVNSPGGSALASDVIHREIVLTRAVKPVVCSMGDVAASGGYYIAAPCNRIFARENTITGSIGVFAVLIGTEKFFTDKTGITFDRVKTHSHADIGDPNRPMDVFEQNLIQNRVTDIYRDFRRVVMEGRHFPDTTAVDTIAGGRVWSGKQALKLGLVDEIGGLDEAIAWAAKEVKLPDYRLVSFPKDQSAFDQFREAFGLSSIRSEILPENVEKFVRDLEQVAKSMPGDGFYMLMPWKLEME